MTQPTSINNRLTRLDVVTTDCTTVINSLLNNGKDYGVEFSNNELLRQIAHTAIDMIED